MELLILLAVFILAFAAMFIGALSGGVGLITRPILILLGYSPQIVVGTSRASSILGELPGIIILQKKRISDKKSTLFLAFPILLGTTFAAIFAVISNNNLLRIIIGVIVILMALFLLFKKDFAEIETKPRFSYKTRTVFAFIGSMIIAFLSTLSGGLGSLYTVLYSWLYGKTYIGSAAMWRVAGYIGSFIVSIIFIVKSLIDWQLFLALSFGFMLGSYLGTYFGLRKGENWVKYLVIIAAIASAIKLLI